MGVSLNAKKVMFFPPMGLSLRWYPEIFEKAVWFDALSNSVMIAFFGGLLAVSIALPTSYFLWRYGVTYAKVLFGLGLVPFSLPPVITALGMLIFWAQWIGHGRAHREHHHCPRRVPGDAAHGHDFLRVGGD